MPELPEVEVARRAIQDHCLGRIIKRAVIADDSKVIDSVSFADFQTSILGKRLLSAHRKGKNMWIQLDSPPYPSFQFGMSGAIHIKGISISKYKRSIVKDSDEWPSKYSKFLVELDDGLELSFTDPRRFAKVRLLQDPVSVPPISELGPDALLEPMSLDDFFSSLSKKKIAIKALLLDQKFISGIGNWIADEVLYQARIHPLQIASSLSKECCATLLQCIKEVIETAIEVGADSSQYPDNWIFHFRDKKPGKAFIDGKKIDFINAGGRTTAYVPELQKLTGTQATQSAGKATKRTSKKSQDEDEDVSDTDNVVENDRTAKSVKKQNPKGIAKKAAAKRKSNDTDEDSSGDEGGEDEDVKPVAKKQNPKGIAKKAAAKRKSNDTDEDSSGDEGGEDEDVKPVAKKMTKSKKIPAAKGRQGVTKRKLNDSDEEKESNPSDRIDEEQKPRGARSSKAKDISGETTKQGRRNKEKKAK